MPRRTSVVMQTSDMTLHLHRESTHQGVVMTLNNRKTGFSKEILSEFENADHDWRHLLAEGASQIAALGPQITKLSNDRPKRIITIIEDEDE